MFQLTSDGNGENTTAFYLLFCVCYNLQNVQRLLIAASEFGQAFLLTKASGDTNLQFCNSDVLCGAHHISESDLPLLGVPRRNLQRADDATPLSHNHPQGAFLLDPVYGKPEIRGSVSMNGVVCVCVCAYVHACMCALLGMRSCTVMGNIKDKNSKARSSLGELFSISKLKTQP